MQNAILKKENGGNGKNGKLPVHDQILILPKRMLKTALTEEDDKSLLELQEGALETGDV